MNQELKFVHIRPYNGGQPAHRGGMTLAYKVPERKGDKMIWVSVATCSHKDAYCKKKGRELATEKFNRGHTIQIATTRRHGFGFQLQMAFGPLMHLSIPHSQTNALF